MPMTCTICTHPERAEIDKAIVGGGSNRTIARQFSVSKDAIARHQIDHLPALLIHAAAVKEEATATNLLARLRGLNAETADVLREAKRAEDHELRLKAIARAEKQIELEGRLLGELQDGTTVNVLVAPEWLAVRAAVLAALVPYPEARAAVAQRLVALGTGDD